MCRESRYDGLTRGVALGYLQCNLVVLRRRYAYDFLVYCQRNQRACPVLEICDVGDPEPRELATGADLRTDLPRYAVYRDGLRGPDVTDAQELWHTDSVAFLIGSGISFDHALEDAGVPTTENRWVLRTSLPTKPAGVFPRKPGGDDALAYPGAVDSGSAGDFPVSLQSWCSDSHWGSGRNRRRSRASARGAAGRSRAGRRWSLCFGLVE